MLPQVKLLVSWQLSSLWTHRVVRVIPVCRQPSNQLERAQQMPGCMFPFITSAFSVSSGAIITNQYQITEYRKAEQDRGQEEGRDWWPRQVLRPAGVAINGHP
jgi:hypothetical protein